MMEQIQVPHHDLVMKEQVNFNRTANISGSVVPKNGKILRKVKSLNLEDSVHSITKVIEDENTFHVPVTAAQTDFARTRKRARSKSKGNMQERDMIVPHPLHLGSCHPTEIIDKLTKKLSKAKEEERDPGEIQVIEQFITAERRELMKIFHKLSKQRMKYDKLLDEEKNLSHILTEEKQEQIRERIPKQAVTRIESEIFLATISGPNLNESVRCYRDYIAAISVSTYPTLKGVGRAGDPICDYYHSRLFEQGTLFALADGCNWGEAPKQAAQRASTCFVRFMQDRLYRLDDTKKITKEILQAFAAAHNSIIEGADTSDFYRIGTATLTGGVLFPLQEKQTKKSSSSSRKKRNRTKDITLVQSDTTTVRIPKTEGKSNSVVPLLPARGKPRKQRQKPVAKSSPRQLKKAVTLDEVKVEEIEHKEAKANIEEAELISKSKPKKSSSKKSSRRSRRGKGEAVDEEVEEVPKASAFVKKSRHKSLTHYAFAQNTLKRSSSPSPLQEHVDESDWAFVFGSVGDCKVFLFDPSLNEVTDITSSNRAESSNAADCGGRLGPYDETLKPDLRNLFVVSTVVKTDDLILVVSDGIHDNLDPELLGRQPGDIDESFETSHWSDLSLDICYTLKTSFQEKKLSSIINRTEKTPESICKALADYCLRVTNGSRTFMQENPTEELPTDYTLYPGKMDHSTCICMKVGSRTNTGSSKLVQKAFAKKDALSTVHLQ